MVDTDEETLTFLTRCVRVQPGQHVSCVGRPRRPPFLWQRFEVRDPELWMIFNVAVGCNSLFKENPGGGAGVSALRLNEEGLLCKDVCKAAQDFSIEAMYIGPDPDGAEFECAIIGRVPAREEDYPERDLVFATPVEGQEDRWVVDLSCGHRKAVGERKASYVCRECPKEKAEA